MKRILLMMFASSMLVHWGVVQAMTAEEECRQRNAASCEANGLKFFMTEQECPRGVKVLRKLGQEDCSKLVRPASAVQSTVGVMPLQQAVPAENSAKAGENANDGSDFWGNPYFMLALVGLLQGMVTRLSIGSAVIVMLVMPLLGTWSIVAGTEFPSGIISAWTYILMEFAGTLLFSLCGWLLGFLIRRVAYRILLR